MTRKARVLSLMVIWGLSSRLTLAQALQGSPLLRLPPDRHLHLFPRSPCMLLRLRSYVSARLATRLWRRRRIL